MNKDETISCLCSLVTEVAEAQGDHLHAHDCFCDGSPRSVTVDKKFVQFIVDATRLALVRQCDRT